MVVVVSDNADMRISFWRALRAMGLSVTLTSSNALPVHESDERVYLIANVSDIEWCLMGLRNACLCHVVIIDVSSTYQSYFGVSCVAVPFELEQLTNILREAKPISEEEKRQSYCKSNWLKRIETSTTHDLYNKLSYRKKEEALGLYKEIKARIPSEYEQAHKEIEEAIEKVNKFTEDAQFTEFAKYKSSPEYRSFLKSLEEVFKLGFVP